MKEGDNATGRPGVSWELETELNRAACDILCTMHKVRRVHRTFELDIRVVVLLLCGVSNICINHDLSTCRIEETQKLKVLNLERGTKDLLPHSLSTEV
jgi:hypothetical protein